MVAASQDPFTLLRRMAQESMSSAPGLRRRPRRARSGPGVAFRLGEMRLVAPLDQVLEVLPCPPMTLVPNTKSWLKGVANVRGNLITIVDLPEYFGKPPVFVNDDARLMILNSPGSTPGWWCTRCWGCGTSMPISSAKICPASTIQCRRI